MHIALCLVLSAATLAPPPRSTPAQPKKVGPVAQSIVPIDPSVPQLPPHYTGASIETIFQRYKHEPKSEFETPDQYQERIAIRTVKHYAVLLGQGEALAPKPTYDPEQQVFHVTFYTDRPRGNYSLRSEKIAFVAKTTRTVLGHHSASNAFGVKKEVTDVRLDEYGVLTWNSQGPFQFSIEFDIGMGADIAKTMKPRLKFLLIFAPAAGSTGVATIERFHSGATIDTPISGEFVAHYVWVHDVEIWAFDTETGEIYTKFAITADTQPPSPGKSPN
ncbi:MAG: hypothetical protein ACHQPI_05080 [Thermoanaerobaculia bacterium]